MDPDTIRDLFAGLGPVRVRRMFGGQGVYRDELMFALEAGGELYLKADGETASAFEKAGSRQFVYTKGDKPMPMSYWRLPDSAVDDPDEASRWGRLAVEAARRAQPRNGCRAAALRFSMRFRWSLLPRPHPEVRSPKGLSLEGCRMPMQRPAASACFEARRYAPRASA